jgi:hypothetical protein
MQVSIASSPADKADPGTDFAGATPRAAVLLDGGEPFDGQSKCSHGAAWYVRHLGGALLARLPDTDQSLTGILADAIAATAALHGHTCDLDHPSTPSSTVAMVRSTGRWLQYLVLADSTLLFDRGDGDPVVLTDDRGAQLVRAYRVAMDAQAPGSAGYEAARRRYVEGLRAFRNKPGGFWRASADPAAAAQAVTGDRRLADLRGLVLLSDGAARIANPFRLASWQEVVGLLGAHGADEVISLVREAEAADQDCARWPRPRAVDDATVLACTDLG